MRSPISVQASRGIPPTTVGKRKSNRGRETVQCKDAGHLMNEHSVLNAEARSCDPSDAGGAKPVGNFRGGEGNQSF